MRVPVVQGILDRRILVNYRVDPQVLASVLPAPFQPKLVDGVGIGGICLIRLRAIRPRFVPRGWGLSSENAAHRIAVQWRQDGRLREGVYIPRRDSSSWLNTLAGGRLFPGLHRHARFQVHEDGQRYDVIMDSDDGDVHVEVHGRVAEALPGGSVFSSVQAASEFFRRGSLGYSATAAENTFEALELQTFSWKVVPLEVERVASSFFECEELFPAGSTQFDCALLMRGIEHQWRAREPLVVGSGCCQADNASLSFSGGSSERA